MQEKGSKQGNTIHRNFYYHNKLGIQVEFAWLPAKNIWDPWQENTDLEPHYDIFIVPFHNTDIHYISLKKCDHATDRNQDCIYWDRNLKNPSGILNGKEKWSYSWFNKTHTTSFLGPQIDKQVHMQLTG